MNNTRTELGNIGDYNEGRAPAPNPNPPTEAAMAAALYSDLCDHVFREFGCLPINADKKGVAIIERHLSEIYERVRIMQRDQKGQDDERKHLERAERMSADAIAGLNERIAKILGVTDLPKALCELREYHKEVSAKLNKPTEIEALRADLAAAKAEKDWAISTIAVTEKYLTSRKMIEVGNGAFAAVDQSVADLVAQLRADLAAKGEALKHVGGVLNKNGDWDDGCFYYNRVSAPELQGCLVVIEAALSTRTSGKDDKGEK